MMSTPLPTSLEGLFIESQRLYGKVTDADFDDDADKSVTIARAKLAIESLQQGVAREGIFSPNEEIEEIATELLPLLATDFYMGSLIIKLPFNNPEARLRDLKQAEALVFKYLDTCEKLDLLDRADSQAWQAMLKEGEHSAPQALQAKGREQKIERFRRQKKVQQRMKKIEAELAQADGKDCERENDGDGMRRERSLLLLASLGTDALDEAIGLTKETEMVEQLVRSKESGRSEGDDAGASSLRDGREQNREHGLEVTHISRVGGNLQIRREDVRADVFKPTVAPPTMTVEEFGEIELERALDRQGADEVQQSTRRRYDQLEMDGDEDDEELVERAAHHDREWDDWKDEHPRGAGNKANKII